MQILSNEAARPTAAFNRPQQSPVNAPDISAEEQEKEDVKLNVRHARKTFGKVTEDLPFPNSDKKPHSRFHIGS